jgi:nucleoside-diphosphate-sugar epimerase
MQKTILLTGASGFIGKALLSVLQQGGYHVRTVSRNNVDGSSEHLRLDLALQPIPPDMLSDVDCIIHLAAYSSAQGVAAEDLLRLNRDVPLQLAKQAAAAGVRRFIFVSTAQINFAKDTYRNDIYTQSKLQAEQALQQHCQSKIPELVIVRPPLVYGPGVKGNFAAMCKMIRRGVWLPFGAITYNRRSILALDNLISFILLCLHHPQATQQPWNIADNDAVSTAELIKCIAATLHRNPRLLNVPVWCLRGLGVFGLNTMLNRLTASAEIDSLPARHHLGWLPVTTLPEQLKQVAATCVNK